MPINPGNHYEANFSAVRKRFIAKLDARLPQFRIAAAELANGNTHITDIEDLRMQAHKLAGSAKTFGFPALNGYAADIERHVDHMLDGAVSHEALAVLETAFRAFLAEAVCVAEHTRETPEPALNPDNIIHPVQASRQPYYVMIVDDDELVRDLLESSLAAVNCRLILIENGARALDYLNRAKNDRLLILPDLVILDVNMPALGGFEVLENLKADHALQAIPVIMLTRRQEEQHFMRGISSGAFDYITKPFTVPTLITRILSTLERYETRVLIIDDDSVIRDTLKHCFYRTGYTVLLAENGYEGLQRMQLEKPDITILDIMMPGINGLTVLNLAKDDPGIRDIPVMMLTGKSHKKNIFKGLEDGAVDYITKPFDIDEVAERIADLVRQYAKSG